MNEKVCQLVTDRILRIMENGVVPWRMPWILTGGSVSHATGESYSWLNQMLLGGGASEFATFKQIKDEGGTVKKGAKSKPVVFWKWLRYDENGKPVKSDDEAKKSDKIIPYLRYYQVFDVENDAEGVERKYPVKDLPDVCAFDVDERAEKVLSAYYEREKLDVKRDDLSDRAFYAPLMDFIRIPAKRQFKDLTAYYNTVFHETVHSTGHSSRLDRPLGGKKGSKSYAQEELVAEIGSCALLTIFGLGSTDEDEQSASYIESWSRKLRDDPSLFVVASGRAQKAVDYILNRKTTAEVAVAE